MLGMAERKSAARLAAGRRLSFQGCDCRGADRLDCVLHADGLEKHREDNQRQPCEGHCEGYPAGVGVRRHFPHLLAMASRINWASLLLASRWMAKS